MSDTTERPVRGEDADMVARAAWMHFVGGLTQNEVAKRLGVPTTRAHRHIARAQSLGLVRITVDVPETSCLALETRLSARFGLTTCRVAMDVPGQEALPLRALAAAGSAWLDQVLDSGAHEMIGIGQGRTLAATVEALASRDLDKKTSFVSLLGGLTRSFAAAPYDVIHMLSQRTRAEAWLMPVPLYVDSEKDRAVLMSQTIMRDISERMAQAPLAVVGIGDLESGYGAISAMADGAEACQALADAGAVAEVLGQFLDPHGHPVQTPLDRRVMAQPLAQLRGRDVVAIAGGTSKHDAIRAALRSGLLTGLITDETTARALDTEEDGG